MRLEELKCVIVASLVQSKVLLLLDYRVQNKLDLRCEVVKRRDINIHTQQVNQQHNPS